MTGRVLIQRQEPSDAGILCGAPVSSGRQWFPMAHGANWLNAQAAVLVPGCVIDKTVSSGTTGVLHFRVLTRAAAIERVWTLMLRGATSGTTATIKAPTSTGTALTVRVAAERDVRLPVIYREVLSSQAQALIDLTIEVAATGGDIEIDSVTCYELTRPLLVEGGDGYGVNTETLRPRERIFEDNGTESVTGVLGSLLSADPRRVGIYHWSVPAGVPVTRTGAYTNLLTLACPVLARKLDRSATVAKVYWSAYCKVNAGSGDVLVTTSHSGASDSVNVTGTSFAWTTKRDIEIDCEDMAAADGLQSSTFDELQIQIRGNGGNTLSLAAVSVWDEEA